MTQTEIENRLVGMWQNLKSRYLWSFYDLDDGKRSGLVTDNNSPVGGVVFYYNIILDNNASTYIELIIGGIRTQHKIVFLTDKIIEIYNPPIDNAGNAPDELITLDRV